MFLLSQSVARCSEAVKAYFEWIEHFSLLMFGCSRDTNNCDFYESIAKQIGSTKSQLTPKECYWTFHHLRLRRNCLVHHEDEASPAYSDICRQRGTMLNRYWATRLKRDCQIDFTNDDPADVNADSFIGIIHTIRLAAESFDKSYCEKIPTEKLQIYITQRFESQINCSKIDAERRNKKLKQFSLRLFNFHFENGCVA